MYAVLLPLVASTLACESMMVVDDSEVSADEDVFVEAQSLTTVYWAEPKGGLVLSGAAALRVGKVPNRTAKVSYRLDNKFYRAVTSAPWATSLDTTNLTDGTHTLQAIVRNAKNVVIAKSPIIKVKVDNGTPLPPTDASPVVALASATTDTNIPVTVTLEATDTETCELTFDIVTPPTSGTLSTIATRPCVAGSPNADSAIVQFTPAMNFSGTDAFTFSVSDGTNTVQVTATLTVTAAATGCDSTTHSGVTLQDIETDFTTNVHPLLTRGNGGCIGCHATSGARSFKVSTDAADSFILAQPFLTDPSILLSRLTATDPNVRMPRGMPAWTASEIAKVEVVACKLKAFGTPAGIAHRGAATGAGYRQVARALTRTWDAAAQTA